MIFENQGITVLDPDGDGYVSKKTNGKQIGFTIPPDNDVMESEIPYVPIVRPDPTSDILRGPVGGFIEIVGTDAAGNNAIMVYNSGTNLLFRFRLGGFAPNSKAYSIMIDTDGKFGSSGVNVDPNALSGNMGFEAEVVLKTNFSVDVYNMDGTTHGTLVATHPYETHSQKALAVSTAGGTPDYFYDFYVPLSDLAQLGITPSTPLRFVAVTVMNPHAAIGNNALSDIGGVTSGSNLDVIFTNLIESQTPTALGNINIGGVLDRSACPVISPVSVSSPVISGTSTEPSGTRIDVYLCQSNGTTLIGSGSTYTSGTTWSINVSSLSPSVTLASGQVVKATATAADKGTSYNNCNIQTVSNCSAPTGSNVVITKINGSKGYTITNTFAAGTIFTWYNADFSPARYVTKSGGSTYIPNPQTSATPNELISFSTETGQTFPAGVFYFTFQEPGKCVSPFISDCQYTAAGTSVAPAITTTVITTRTSFVSGTCGSSAGTQVSLFADGIFLKSTTVVNSTNWTISGLNLANYSCATITATSTDADKCATTSATGVVVSHVAAKPVISTSGCTSSNPLVSVKGFSTEADGTTITLYKTNPSRTLAGTASISNGEWTVTGLSLIPGDNIVAAVTAGACVTTSADSDPVTISSKTSISDYNISINTPKESQSSVSGTISGGIYPATLRLYIDDAVIGNPVTINTAGNWSVGGLLLNDLYTGGIVKVTITSTGCESDQSNASAVVQCITPLTPDYSGGSYEYCYGNSGNITVNTTQKGVIYQLVNGTGNPVGPSVLGNGNAVVLYSNPLTADLTNVYVKAYKMGFSTCSSTATSIINLTPQKPSPTITFLSTNVNVQKGNTTVNLPFTAKSNNPSADSYTIEYSLAAKSQGFVDLSIPVSVPAAPGNIALTVPSTAETGTYSGTIQVTSSGGSACSGSYSFTVTIYGPGAVPVISSHPINKTICSGNTTTLSATAAGAGTLSYQWQSATSFFGPYTNVSGGSGATSATYTTASLTATTYYRLMVSNTFGSSVSNVATITVNSLPVASGIINGESSVCAGQNHTYTINSISNTSGYSWNYSGANVTISGSSNSVSIEFGTDATSGTLAVAGINGCGSGNQLTLPITVTPMPFINNITVNTCSGSAFNITPVNGVNGVVPAGTTYTWGVPVVTGGMIGGTSGTGAGINGLFTNTTTSLQTAIYTVTPTKGSCSGNPFTITINVSPRINITLNPIDALCYGTSTGNINASVTGGVPGYTYAWSGPGPFSATTPSISSIEAGSYSLTVTDSRNCTSTASAMVSQPAGMTITPAVTSVSCNGGSNGEISISVSGGNGTKTYLWNDGSSQQNRTGLASGTYSVVVTDASGCSQSSGEIVVSQPLAISASATASPITCFGGNSIVTTTASGGTGSLMYSLNGGTYQAGNTFSSLAASASPYIISVKDGNNCTKTETITISQPPKLNLSTSMVKETCPGSSNGSIDLTVSGGTTPYNIDWNDVPGINNTEDRTGLTSGTYTVTVTDDNSCTSLSTVKITAINPSPVTPGTITK